MISFIFSINQKFRFVLSLIYLGILVTLSLMPSKDVPNINLFEGFDKFVHICLYLGFAWLLCWSFHIEKRTSFYYLILILTFSWGIVMEIFQYEMHLGRAFEILDIISNTSGALTGIIIYILMIKIKRPDN